MVGRRPQHSRAGSTFFLVPPRLTERILLSLPPCPRRGARGTRYAGTRPIQANPNHIGGRGRSDVRAFDVAVLRCQRLQFTEAASGLEALKHLGFAAPNG